MNTMDTIGMYVVIVCSAILEVFLYQDIVRRWRDAKQLRRQKRYQNHLDTRRTTETAKAIVSAVPMTDSKIIPGQLRDSAFSAVDNRTPTAMPTMPSMIMSKKSLSILSMFMRLVRGTLYPLKVVRQCLSRRTKHEAVGATRNDLFDKCDIGNGQEMPLHG